MNRQLIAIAALLIWNINILNAQNTTTTQEEIKAVIGGFFVGMESKDTMILDSLMHDNCMLYSTLNNEKGEVINEVIYKASLMDYMRRAMAKKYVYNEKLWSYDIAVEDNIATAWTEYTMFVGESEQLSHCGVNIFQLIRNPQKRWVIVSIADTRRKNDCIEKQPTISDETKVNTLLDNWHQAAAKADEETFFGAMTADGIYLGTDGTERWERDELRKWSKFAFERESAWDFTPSNRTIYFSDNQKMAWFEESLATWMGPCRGSGVLVKQGGEWKIKHYNLSVLLPNDLVHCFVHLVEKGKCKRKAKKK